MLGDIIVIAVIALVIGGATAYIIKAKKSGAKCIGCPNSYSCSSKNNGSNSHKPCGGNCSCCSGTCEDTSEK